MRRIDVKFEGNITIPAPRDTVFEKLRDARVFASCIEGVQDLKEIDETHYTAILATRIAYIGFKFEVDIEITEITPPSRIVAKSVGKPLGVVGRLSATSVANLSDAIGETNIAYEIDVTLAGKLGSIGQPVLKSKAREMEKQFARNLRAIFGEDGTKAGP